MKTAPKRTNKGMNGLCLQQEGLRLDLPKNFLTESRETVGWLFKITFSD